MSSEVEEEQKFKIRSALETPAYQSNQQFEAAFDSLEDIANLKNLERSEVDFLTDLLAEDNLEDIEEISSGPMMTEDKLVLCLETPEYQDNIIVQVNREDFFKYPEMAKIDFKKFTEEVMIDEDKDAHEDLVFLVETPEYHKNLLISTSKLDFDFNQLQARIQYAAEASEDINEEINEAKKMEGLVLMIEGPEYYSNTLLQVCFFAITAEDIFRSSGSVFSKNNAL